MMSEEARSYIIFFREGGGKMSAYIGIHLLLTGRKLFYSHTSNPFPERNLSSVEEEARSFAEGLGAMLDEVNLSTMSRDEKDRWIDAQDIFTPDREKVEAPAAPAQAAPVAEAPSVPQQPLQSQPALPVQDMQQPPQKTQPVAAASVIPQSSQAQQVQPDAVPQAPKVPPSLQEQQVQQQPVQHVSPEPIVPEPQTTAVPQAKSRKQQAEKEAAPAAHSEEEIWEFTEQAYSKAAQASTESKERHEIMDEAIKAGIVKPSKPKMKKDVQTATGVVSRDREALARLLASF
jgi:hypothetical protein